MNIVVESYARDNGDPLVAVWSARQSTRQLRLECKLLTRRHHPDVGFTLGVARLFDLLETEPAEAHVVSPRLPQ